MRMIWEALVWYLLVAAGGVGGYSLLRRLGFGAGSAWAAGRMVGWVVAGYGGWLVGSLGLREWWLVVAAIAVALIVVGRRQWRDTAVTKVGEAELIGLLAFVFLALLRLPAMGVTGTEKPMDLAILATLLRPGTFPPGDPWLAGSSLPYYYWGFVPWVAPARLLSLAPDVAFNLLVPTLAAVTAQAGWALARALGGSRRSAAFAAWLVVFAGTPDGWRQLVAGSSLASLDLWPSSRAISGTITEFPLFTFSLGDLHPHLLALPEMLVAILLACTLLGAPRRATLPVLLGALFYGAAAAANPWCALPLGLAVLLVAVAQPAELVRPWAGGRSVWLRVVAVGAGGAMLFLPFWLSYHAPISSLGWVTTPTRWDELGLFLGAALLPPLLVSWVLCWRLGGFDPRRRQLFRAGWVAAIVLAGIGTGRVALALALGLGAILGVGVLGAERRRARTAWALTLVPLLLLAAVEAVYVADPYAGELYRMNTVFKASHIAFTLLAVVGPVLLGWLRRGRPVVACLAAALVLAAGMPHFTALGLRAFGGAPAGWGGLAWMGEEVEVARWLHRLPSGTTLVEGVGDAYSDAARMSAASGVPTVLGWENHERVWRWGADQSELARRRALVDELYRCGRPARVRQIANLLRVSYLVVGGVERRLYPLDGLAAVREAGKIAFAAGGCVVVRVDG